MPLTHIASRLIAAVAIGALPIVAASQAPISAAQADSAASHLMAARAALDRLLTAPAPTADTLRTLSNIDVELRLLAGAANERSPDWEAHYRIIGGLVVGLLEPPVPTGILGSVGTSGTIGVPTMTVNAYMTADLETFQSELSEFAQAMAAIPLASAAAEPGHPAVDPSVLVGLDSVSAMLDAALKANANPASGKVSVDRALLEQAKRQLDQIRQALKNP
jgi:hypothetical protein